MSTVENSFNGEHGAAYENDFGIVRAVGLCLLFDVVLICIGGLVWWAWQ